MYSEIEIMGSNFGLRLLLTAALILMTVWIFILNGLKAKQNQTKEPVSIPASIPIPFLGHVLGLLWQKNAYYTTLSKKCRLPIFSLSMFGGKVHVVSSPELMSPLHKVPRQVSFWFMEAQFTAQLGNMSKESAEKLQANLNAHPKEPSLLLHGLQVTQHAMSSQGGMDDMAGEAAQHVKRHLDQLWTTSSAAGAGTKRGTATSKGEVDLWEWVQHEITVGTTQTVYGPANPYNDKSVEDGFWNFADDTVLLLLAGHLGLSRFLATKARAGREVVVNAMRTYFASAGYNAGSSLVKARFAALQGQISSADIARFECVNGIAILANTVPTAFWTIYHVFSDTQVLNEVRRQVGAITITAAAADGSCVRRIDLRKLKEAPILFSIIQEALRWRATGTGPRMVTEDVHVDLGEHQYLLKKGSVVIIANKSVHSHLEAWGDGSASRFVADRFCQRVPAASAHAFRGFGGGVNLCPGRAFAMGQIAALVSMLAMRFELIPVVPKGRDGTWIEPGQDLQNMSLQIAPPKKAVVVRIERRVDLDNSEWEFLF